VLYLFQRKKEADMATAFVNMRRWSEAKLDKELAFSCPDSPCPVEREWAQAVLAEQARRK
jgi:hypothetical protein